MPCRFANGAGRSALAGCRCCPLTCWAGNSRRPLLLLLLLAVEVAVEGVGEVADGEADGVEAVLAAGVVEGRGRRHLAQPREGHQLPQAGRGPRAGPQQCRDAQSQRWERLEQSRRQLVRFRQVHRARSATHLELRLPQAGSTERVAAVLRSPP